MGNINPYDPINYNLLTDGLPNDRNAFVQALQRMIKPQVNMTLAIFITINICTDDENIIEFYNNLDRRLGNECCGMDVLDDWHAETIEIERINPFLCYSE